MQHFADHLINKAKEKQSPICLGLDPHFEKIPDVFKKNTAPERAIEDYLVRVMQATAEHVVAVKPNIAFFEEWGAPGIVAFDNICEKAKELGLLVVVDAKRGDIGSTAEAYARAFLTKDIYDSLTINPYFGEDGVRPFINYAEKNGKGLFILVKTSNPTGGEFQDLVSEDSFVHEHVARAVARWGSSSLGAHTFSLVGAVVGATYPEDIKNLRREMAGQVFLIPGYGAQGGTAEDVMGAFYEGGKGAIINSSRKILFAGDENNFEEASAEEAKKAKNEFISIW